DAVVDPVSLYDPVYSEGSDSLYLMDQIKDDNDEVENWMISCALREAASTLGEREQKILKLRYYLGRTQTEVASEIGISQAQVSRLEKSALETIRRRI
ncbi:MAG: sigma-70 family RNA polymerase sigma factor, partial [Clostridia bacterium]|nr:sigma-70 family RNA polymerase sigma factor [Clostridia bacterium]